MTFTGSMQGRSGERSVKIHNPLDCGKVRTYRNNNDRHPDKTGDTPKDKEKESFRPAEKSNAFKGIINFPFYLLPVPDLRVHNRLYECVHQGSDDRESNTPQNRPEAGMQDTG